MIIAVDTGGTKTAVASFTRSGAPMQFTKFLTPKNKASYINLVTQAIESLCIKKQPSAIAIALPGIIKDGTALWCKNLGWHNFDVVSRLRKNFPCVPIFVENDANLAGLSESILQRQSKKRVLYITISTGIGTGFAQNGNIVDYLQLSEGGQMLLHHDGIMQKWGEFASGRAIYNKYGKLASEIKDNKTWREIANLLTPGLLTIIPLTQPDTIILGGSVGAHSDPLIPQLESILQDELPAYIIRPKILKAAHPEQAVLYGGYQYAISQLSDKQA